ncbi:MAG: hypothetical protein Q6354_06100 [Candidatus Brocadiales bacterium]|nr:hypothetical protein [Candidatus Brocadiales bacterium]
MARERTAFISIVWQEPPIPHCEPFARRLNITLPLAPPIKKK